MKMESLLLELENTKCYFLQRNFDLAFSSCASVHQCRCVIMHLVEYGPVRVYVCVKEIIFSIDEYLLDGNGFIKKGKYIGKLTGNIKRAQRRKILINSRIKSQMEVLCRQRIWGNKCSQNLLWFFRKEALKLQERANFCTNFLWPLFRREKQVKIVNINSN